MNLINRFCKLEVYKKKSFKIIFMILEMIRVYYSEGYNS